MHKCCHQSPLLQALELRAWGEETVGCHRRWPLIGGPRLRSQSRPRSLARSRDRDLSQNAIINPELAFSLNTKHVLHNILDIRMVKGIASTDQYVLQCLIVQKP